MKTIIKRCKETRRMHPLSSTSRSLDEAVRRRPVLAPSASGRSTSLTPRPSLHRQAAGGGAAAVGDEYPGRVSASSPSASSTASPSRPTWSTCAFCPTLHIAELRHQTGLDGGMHSFVFGYQQTKDFMAHMDMSASCPSIGGGKAALIARHRLHPAGSTARWPLPRPWPTSSSRRAIRLARRTTGT